MTRGKVSGHNSFPYSSRCVHIVHHHLPDKLSFNIHKNKLFAKISMVGTRIVFSVLGQGAALHQMVCVAAKMMRIRMITTITPIIIIILMFFHQYFLATRVDVLWNESA